MNRDLDWFDLPSTTGLFVYALYGADAAKPLYIGQSSNLISRLGAHLSNPGRRAAIQRIAVSPCRSLPEMLRTERALIEQHQPPWNVAFVADRRGSIRLRAVQLADARRRANLESDADLAEAMGLPKFVVKQTLSGDRKVNPKFIAGLRKAFPGSTVEDFCSFEAAIEAVPA